MNDFIVNKAVEMFRDGERFEFDGSTYTVDGTPVNTWGLVEVNTTAGGEGLTFTEGTWLRVVEREEE